jgi:hypothetical protein
MSETGYGQVQINKSLKPTTYTLKETGLPLWNHYKRYGCLFLSVGNIWI